MSHRYDDGEVEIYKLKNVSDPGDMPSYKISTFLGPEAFAEIEIGVTRQYLAKGANEQIDLLIQIHAHERRPMIGQIAVIRNWRYQENDTGDQYRIDNVQLTEEDRLPIFLLTLSRLGDHYDYLG